MAPTLRLRAASISPPRPTMNSVLPPPMSTTSTCCSNTGTAWSTPRWISRASSTPEITSTPTLALARAASRKSSRFSASRTALVATAWTSAPKVSAMRRNRPRAATPRSMASGWSSFMSPDPVPSRTTSLSRARISNRLFPVGRATTRWKLLVPMSIAATGTATWGACDTTRGRLPPPAEGLSPRLPSGVVTAAATAARTPMIVRTIATELAVREHQVKAAVDLLDGGATVPFVARYRKEATGGLDDAQLRTLEERLRYLRELEERRAAILESIEAQGKLDDDLRARIMAAETKARLEDIYLPYKPKRRTKAQIAREAGLEPLADGLLGDPTLDPAATAAAYVDAEKGVADAAAALDGARAILTERFGEDADLIGALRER